MKAAVLNALNGTFDIENIDIDVPKGREVLVEVKASGLCHSDLHMAQNDFGVPLPAVLGHELAGIVKQVGPDVREFQVGDHVVGSLIQYCGHCEACLDGRTYQCAHPEETLRATADGQRLTRAGQPVTAVFGTAAFAELALVHENQLARVPEALPFPQASILGCGCVTGAGAAINTADVKPGDTVAVLGVGGVGLNVISGARLAGAGVQHAFEVIGLKPTSEQSIKMARKGGAAYMIGIHKPGSSIAVDALGDLIDRQVTVKGVYMGSSNIKHDIPMYAELYLQGRFNLDDLISREISLAEINGAYDELKKGVIARSVITSF